MHEPFLSNLAASVHGDQSGDRARAAQPAEGRSGVLLCGPFGLAAPADPANGMIPAGRPEDEMASGAESYLETLARIHQALRPRLYLEIGVRAGRSLELARGAAIGIDPAMALAQPVPGAALFHKTSDEFFEIDAEAAIDEPIDLAFIDGLHLFEYALRDFRNIEKWSSSTGLIVADDIFPTSAVQGSRFRRTRAWTGDVWRLVACLAAERPDLLVVPLDCAPAGLLLIAGLDPSNDVLSKRYDSIVNRHLSGYLDDPPPEVMARAGVVAPGDPLVDELISTLKQHREERSDVVVIRSSLDRFRHR